MLFWILGDILVQLGCQDGSEIAEKFNENLSSFFNDFFMDFGSPEAAFEVRGHREPKVGNVAGASRAISLVT